MTTLPILIISTTITDHFNCEAKHISETFVKYTPSVFDPTEYVWQGIQNPQDAFVEFALAPEGSQFWLSKYSAAYWDTDALADALDAQGIVSFNGSNFPFGSIVKLIK